MRRARRAFTQIELLMVLGIIGILFSLLLPAAQSARETARRFQCLNNLRQVGIALIGEANRKNRFPASGTFSAVGPEQYASWVVPILNDLDQPDLANSWVPNKPWDDVASGNARTAQYQVGVLVCPSDTTVVPGHGNLSYVVNGGFGYTQPIDCPISPHWGGIPTPTVVAMDFNGDGQTCETTNDTSLLAQDKALYYRTGLFFVENQPIGSGTVRHHSLSDVTDGAATTILLSENVRAGYDPTSGTSWATSWPPCNSFFLSGYACAGGSCKAGAVDYSRVNDHHNAPQNFEAINASLDQAEEEAPWPSSNHSGGVNMILCDGHGQFVRDTVDGSVYAALVSPQGMRLTSAMKQSLPGSDSW